MAVEWKSASGAIGACYRVRTASCLAVLIFRVGIGAFSEWVRAEHATTRRKGPFLPSSVLSKLFSLPRYPPRPRTTRSCIMFAYLRLRAGAGAGAMGRDILGLLKVRVLRGVNLAVRDLRSSDPYVVLKMGNQKLRTGVVRRNTNPVWNEELTLVVDDPTLPVRLEVFDKDTFSTDDPMGDAEFDVSALAEAVKMNLQGLPNGTIITKVAPRRQNCLADESPVYWSDGTVLQDLVLRLRNVECGEIELKLWWVSVPDSKIIL